MNNKPIPPRVARPTPWGDRVLSSFVLAAVLAPAGIMTAAAPTVAAESFTALAPVSEDELAGTSGGFQLNGFTINVGIIVRSVITDTAGINAGRTVEIVQTYTIDADRNLVAQAPVVTEDPGAAARAQAEQTRLAAEQTRTAALAAGDKVRSDTLAAAEQTRTDAITAGEQLRTDALTTAIETQNRAIAAAEQTRTDAITVGEQIRNDLSATAGEVRANATAFAPPVATAAASPASLSTASSPASPLPAEAAVATTLPVAAAQTATPVAEAAMPIPMPSITTTLPDVTVTVPVGAATGVIGALIGPAVPLPTPNPTVTTALPDLTVPLPNVPPVALATTGAADIAPAAQASAPLPTGPLVQVPVQIASTVAQVPQVAAAAVVGALNGIGTGLSAAGGATSTTASPQVPSQPTVVLDPSMLPAGRLPVLPGALGIRMEGMTQQFILPGTVLTTNGLNRTVENTASFRDVQQHVDFNITLPNLMNRVNTARAVQMVTAPAINALRFGPR